MHTQSSGNHNKQDSSFKPKVKNTFLEFPAEDEPAAYHKRRTRSDNHEMMKSPLVVASKSPNASPLLQPVDETRQAVPIDEVDFEMLEEACEVNDDGQQHTSEMIPARRRTSSGGESVAQLAAGQNRDAPAYIMPTTPSPFLHSSFPPTQVPPFGAFGYGDMGLPPAFDGEGGEIVQYPDGVGDMDAMGGFMQGMPFMNPELFEQQCMYMQQMAWSGQLQGMDGQMCMDSSMIPPEQLQAMQQQQQEQVQLQEQESLQETQQQQPEMPPPVEVPAEPPMTMLANSAPTESTGSSEPQKGRGRKGRSQEEGQGDSSSSWGGGRQGGWGNGGHSSEGGWGSGGHSSEGAWGGAGGHSAEDSHGHQDSWNTDHRKEWPKLGQDGRDDSRRSKGKGKNKILEDRDERAGKTGWDRTSWDKSSWDRDRGSARASETWASETSQAVANSGRESGGKGDGGPAHVAPVKEKIIQIPAIPYERPEGNEPYTTVMLRNIPNKYTREMLIKQLSLDFNGEFDFMYLPIDFKNKCNVGYGFLNFRSQDSCERFIGCFHGVDVRKCLPGLNSKKIVEVTPARVQGLSENVRRLRNSPVMNQLSDHPEWMPLLFDENGIDEPFPMPDQPLPPVKPRGRNREGGGRA